MASELKPGFHIEEFVSGGPKNYAYRIVDLVTGRSETVCNVREITLNYSSSQTVNFEVILAVVLRGDGTETVTVDTERKIKSKRGDVKMHIVTKPEDKIYRVSEEASLRQYIRSIRLYLRGCLEDREVSHV